MILAVLERHGMGPEWRRSMRGAQIGDMLGRNHSHLSDEVHFEANSFMVAPTLLPSRTGRAVALCW